MKFSYILASELPGLGIRYPFCNLYVRNWVLIPGYGVPPVYTQQSQRGYTTVEYLVQYYWLLLKVVWNNCLTECGYLPQQDSEGPPNV